jgi:hypothetical protein
MSSPTASLLGLPSNIRNRIYRHLSHEINAEWRWNHWPLSGNAAVSKICVPDAPSPNALMVSREWCDDYLKSACFHDLSITVNISVHSATNYSQAYADEKRVADQLLPRVSRATIVVGNDATGKLDEHLWFNIFLLSKALASRAPRLTTIKVVATELVNRPLDCVEQNQMCSELGDRQEFFPSPYESLVGLPLRTHEEDGCYCDCESAACDVVDMFDSGIAIAELVSMCERDVRTGTWLFARVKAE